MPLPAHHTCLDCGTVYPARVGWCAGCGSVGRVILLGQRPGAAIDTQPEVADAASLARMAGDPEPLPGLDQVLVGHGALGILVGAQGSGKSTLAARLLDAQPGPVLFASCEEGLGPTLAQRLRRLGITRRDFHLIARASVDDIIDNLRRVRAVALVVDSVQAAEWSPRDLRHVLALHPRLRLLLAVSQVNARGVAEGRRALLHEADLVLDIADGVARLTKSRYQEISNGTSVLPVLHGAGTGSSLRQSAAPIRHLRLVQQPTLREGDRSDREPDDGV